MNNEVYRGVVRGGMIVLAEEAPLTEGTEVLVTLSKGTRGLPTTVLAAVENSPPVPKEWVDELEQLIAEGRRVPTYDDPFAEEPANREGR